MVHDLYVDASCIGDVKGVGVVVGAVVVSEVVDVAGDGLVAEFAAVVRGLDVVAEFAVAGDVVVVHSDCRPLIELLGRACAVPRLVPWIARVQQRRATLQAGGVDVEFRWIPRHKNTAADALSRAAIGAPRVSAAARAAARR